MPALLDPEIWWNTIERRFGDRRLTIALLALAIAGALGIAMASEIGIRYFNTDWNYVLGYAVQRDRTWQPFLALWAGIAIAPIVQGLVGAALLKIYSQPQLWMRGSGGRDHRFDSHVYRGPGSGAPAWNSALRHRVCD